MHGCLNDDHGPVNDEAEVNGAKTHEVAGNAKDVHQSDSKQHGKWNDGRNDQTGPKISKHNNQHEDHNQCSLCQVCGDSTDCLIHQLGAIKEWVDDYTFGKILFDLLDSLLHILDHFGGVGPF